MALRLVKLSKELVNPVLRRVSKKNIATKILHNFFKGKAPNDFNFF